MLIHAIVVLYKMRYEDSPTLQSLVNTINSDEVRQDFKFHLNVCNNSPSDFDSGSWEKWLNQFEAGIEANLSLTPKNERLSVLYNRSINGVLKEKAPSKILILDQDTVLTPGFFTNLKEAIYKWPGSPIYVPKVLSEKDHRTVSPIISDANAVPGKNGTKGLKCIASGMVLSSHFCKDASFDERFTLYGADIDISYQIRRQSEYFVMLEYELQHELSSELSESEQMSSWRRLEKLRAEFLLSRKYKSRLSHIWRVTRHTIKEVWYAASHRKKKHLNHLLSIIPVLWE